MKNKNNKPANVRLTNLPNRPGKDNDADKSGTDTGSDKTEKRKGPVKYDKPGREVNPDKTGIDKGSDKTKK